MISILIAGRCLACGKDFGRQMLHDAREGDRVERRKHYDLMAMDVDELVKRAWEHQDAGCDQVDVERYERAIAERRLPVEDVLMASRAPITLPPAWPSRPNIRIANMHEPAEPRDFLREMTIPPELPEKF